jgi:hypothetical protein
MLDIKIRRLQAEDAEDFRAIRLAALKKSPEMFGSFYALEAEKPLQFFADRLTNCAVFAPIQTAGSLGSWYSSRPRALKMRIRPH